MNLNSVSNYIYFTLAFLLTWLTIGLIEVVQIPFDFGRVSKDDCTQLTGSRGVKLQRVLMTVKLTLSEFASVSLWCNHTQLSSVELKYRD